MTITPFVRRLLYAVLATFASAGVLAAAVMGGDDGDGARDLGVGATTTVVDPGPVGGAGGGDGAATESTAPAPSDPSAAAPSTTAGGAASAPTTVRATGGATAAAPATTAAPAAPAAAGFEDLGAAESGGEVAVPKAGTYRYAMTRGGERSEGTTKFEDKGAAPDGARKLVVTILGQGFDSTNDVLWGASDVKVSKSVITFGGKQYECDWEPDYVEMVLPLSKGAAWDATSTCTVSGFGPAPVTVKRTTTNKVADARRVRVAGETVDVWMITGTEKFEAGGQSQGEATTTTWFSGKHGLIVRSESDTPEGKTELELQSFQPTA